MRPRFRARLGFCITADTNPVDPAAGALVVVVVAVDDDGGAGAGVGAGAVAAGRGGAAEVALLPFIAPLGAAELTPGWLPIPLLVTPPASAIGVSPTCVAPCPAVEVVLAAAVDAGDAVVAEAVVVVVVVVVVVDGSALTAPPGLPADSPPSLPSAFCAFHAASLLSLS